MRKLLITVLLTVCASTTALARGQFFGYVSKGGNSVVTGGSQSSSKVQLSYPGARVSVYISGTSTLATLYSDSSGTAKANQFAAGTDGSFTFWTDTPTVDITFDQKGITTQCGSSYPGYPCVSAFTWSGIAITASAGSTLGCTGGADITTALQSAVTALTGGGTVSLSAGTCVVTDTITVANSGINITGAGTFATFVNFVPTSGGKPLFSYTSGASVQYNSSLSNLDIQSTDTTYQKIAIRLTDVSKFRLENVEVGSQFHGPGLLGAGTSIALQIRGRELGVVNNVTLSSDSAISIEDNPNTAGVLDLDQWHFSNIYTLTTGTHPHFKFASGIQVIDFVLDGANIGSDNGLGLGTGSGDYINWIDTALATASSDGFYVSGSRLEGAVGGTAYFVNIQKNTSPLRNVVFKQDHTGSGILNKGWYMRNVSNVTLLNSFYYGTIEGLNCDSTCDALALINNKFLGGSTVTLTGMHLQHRRGRPVDSTEPVYYYEEWSSNNNNNNTFQVPSVTFTNLSIPPDGNIYFCSDCDPPTAEGDTCTSAGVKTGAMAMRIRSTWKCYGR